MTKVLSMVGLLLNKEVIPLKVETTIQVDVTPVQEVVDVRDNKGALETGMDVSGVRTKDVANRPLE